MAMLNNQMVPHPVPKIQRVLVSASDQDSSVAVSSRRKIPNGKVATGPAANVQSFRPLSSNGKLKEVDILKHCSPCIKQDKVLFPPSNQS